jgi:hypothetical protein
MHSSHRSKPYAAGALGLSFALLAFGCTNNNRTNTPASGGSNQGGATSSGGKSGQGGTSSSGGQTSSGGSNASGGSNQGGSNASGGSNQGGSANSGGSNSGGSNQGGSNQGGSANSGGSSSGGSNQGGTTNKGGSSAGGSNQGGSANSGGSSSGGSNSGGSSSGGSNSGGSSAGGTGAGGSNTGGTSSGGGSTSAATALSCTDPAYGTVSIPAINVISDFENNSLLQYVQDGRGQDALPWYAYAHDDQNDSFNIMQTAGAHNPLNAANKFAVDNTQHGPCSTKGALHVTSPGPGASGQYVGFGIDFMARPLPTKKKLAYDGSKYTGVGFWAKCNSNNADLQFAFSKVVDAAQDADISTSIVSSPCSYSSGTICNQYGEKNTVITQNWSYYKMFFSELLQDPNGATFTSGVDPKKLVAFQIHVNPFSPRTGTPTVNPIDCYIDDVHFLSEAVPTTPAATVTWSTSGNVIKRNGAAYKIRGLGRSSLEWDCAGFGINREDIMRIKTWHPNAIRLSVMDTLWAGTSTGNATCNGGAYQKQVKRVINWFLQQGIDVIFDLHYVGGTPSAANATFWDTISKDAFFKDGRIIYELYNEPTADINTLRTWHNGTIATIRANGAKNLILVSGTDYTFDISGYASSPVTDSANAVAYTAHPYNFKPKTDTTTYLTPAKTIPVVATEFGTAYVPGLTTLAPTTCTASVYSDYISSFETAGMSWTAFAWIVDQWGCSFPQLILDYSGTPNGIGTPVQTQLKALNP